MVSDMATIGDRFAPKENCLRHYVVLKRWRQHIQWSFRTIMFTSFLHRIAHRVCFCGPCSVRLWIQEDGVFPVFWCGIPASIRKFISCSIAFNRTWLGWVGLGHDAVANYCKLVLVSGGTDCSMYRPIRIKDLVVHVYSIRSRTWRRSSFDS